jgi:16S rRNA (cytosine967-C5)-methyltransferase
LAASTEGQAARRVAVEALVRIEEGAYANLVLGPTLERAELSGPDRRLVTELVYGTTRMRRACDWLLSGLVARRPDARTLAALRIGVYQLVFLKTPPHAAVNTTVTAAPKRTRGFVNAVLRRVDLTPVWPSEPVRLSYPDWVVERLWADLGDDAAAALEAMNTAAVVSAREDGYIQDRASQMVVERVASELAGGARVVDLCAGPGGKATGLAAAGLRVVANEVRGRRASLVAANAAAVGAPVAVVQGDGSAPPFAAGSVDAVLVDAPCSGLGVLRRRPDARWRVQPGDVEELVGLQQRLLEGAASLITEGGLLAYSVCTLTAAETMGVDQWLGPGWRPVGAWEHPWRPWGRGGLLLPQVAGTDGMFLLLLRRS